MLIVIAVAWLLFMWAVSRTSPFERNDGPDTDDKYKANRGYMS